MGKKIKWRVYFYPNDYDMEIATVRKTNKIFMYIYKKGKNIASIHVEAEIVEG